MAQAGFEQVELVVQTMAQTAVDNETYFCELDAVVGDGDFGYSLARGFEIVLADWDDLDRTDVATFLRKVAVILTSRIGGTSGPIWGTAFLRAGGAASGADGIGADETVAMLRAGIEGIKQRGGSDLGDKTLLDSLEPAVDALEEPRRGEGSGAALAAAAAAAKEAAEATRPMLAKRGRAAYTGERSIGTLDAGAVASRSCSSGSPRPGRRPDAGRRGPHTERWRGEEVRQRSEGLRARDAQGHRSGQPGHRQVRARVQPHHADRRTPDDKVSIVQGSGSGHEPAHVMAVGKGMLDAACPGDVFSAPPMDYVLETTKLLNSAKGVLHIINNYTGDRMAFDMGREMAEAEGVTIGTVIVDDDVAVKDSTYTVGRRGVAGNFFVIKALGAASEQGAGLDELVALGERVNSVARTMGMALTSCTPPAKGSPLFDLGDDEMEMGVGIHGEPGRRREKLASSNEIVDELLEAVVSDLPFESGDDVALMINGLGGTPISELYLIYGYAHEQLASRGINVARNYVGEYCTSLDMAGASLTLVKLDDELTSLLEAPAEIPIRVF